MTDPKQSLRSGGLSLYFIFSAVCGAVLALASIAFRADAELTGRLHAKGLNAPDTIAAVHADPRVAALTSIDSHAESLTGQKQSSSAQMRTALVAHPPVKVIARVDDKLVATASDAQPVASVGSDEDELAGTTAWTPPKGVTYRTVCVRLCDGAMVPVSFSTRRGRLLKDAERCAQQCGSPSRLFVYPTTGSPDDMVDMDGRAYRDLPTAYKFRVDYDAACSCRAQPWETAALDQHRAWALAQAAQPPASITAVATGVAPVDVMAGHAAPVRSVEQPVAVASHDMSHEKSVPKPSETSNETAHRVDKLAPNTVESSPSSKSSPGEPSVPRTSNLPVAIAKKSKLAAAAAVPHSKAKLASKPQRSIAAVAAPVSASRPSVSKKTIVVVKAKPSALQAAPVAVAAARATPKPVQRSSVQVAELTSHRKWGMQRSFRGDDWRISVWEPR